MEQRQCTECGAGLERHAARCPLCGAGGELSVRRAAKARRESDIDRYHADVRRLRDQLKSIRRGASAV
jgi:predicted RNA-binding Zn-ribbon protein involved in translation (DUF1610 family)